MKKKAGGAKKPHSGYRRVLLARRKEVVAGLGVKFDTLARMGRVAEDDQAQITHEEYVSLSKNNIDYGQLRLIDEALERIQSGDYGVCLKCDAEIPGKRLDAVPWARYCVNCQEEAALTEEPHANNRALPIKP